MVKDFEQASGGNEMSINMFRRFPVLFAVAACSFATAAPAAQERWRVSEGLVSEPHGVWTIETKGEELTGYAEMFDNNGERTAYFLTGKRENGELVFDRQSVDAKQKCTYKISGMPQETGDPLSGVLDCDGETKPWLAKKIPEPIEIQYLEQNLPNFPY